MFEMPATLCKGSLVLLLLGMVAGCATNFAPVTESQWHPYYKGNQGVHRVMRGETLYSIAFHYDTDYRTLAGLNHITPPYTLKVGQLIHVQATKYRQAPPKRMAYQAPLKIRPQKIYSPANRYARSASGWLWPVSGHVVTSFIPEQGKKGIRLLVKREKK